MNRNADLFPAYLLLTIAAFVAWLWIEDPGFYDALRATLRVPFWKN